MTSHCYPIPNDQRQISVDTRISDLAIYYVERQKKKSKAVVASGYFYQQMAEDLIHVSRREESKKHVLMS